MKKPVLITLTAALFLLAGCSMKEIIDPVTGELNNSSSKNENGNGGNSDNSTTNSDSYQPVTKGSTWVYNMQDDGPDVATSTITMTSDVKTINNNIYYKATETLPDGPSNGYFGHVGNVYYKFDEDESSPSPYFDDSKPVGASFSTEETIDGINEKTTVTTIEKGIAKSVNGKTFNNVIHTRVEILSIDTNTTSIISNDTTDYYIVKGIGLIEMDAYYNTIPILKETIVSYHIK